jgi:hypothetical protein
MDLLWISWDKSMWLCHSCAGPISVAFYSWQNEGQHPWPDWPWDVWFNPDPLFHFHLLLSTLDVPSSLCIQTLRHMAYSYTWDSCCTGLCSCSLFSVYFYILGPLHVLLLCLEYPLWAAPAATVIPLLWLLPLGLSSSATPHCYLHTFFPCRPS